MSTTQGGDGEVLSPASEASKAAKGAMTAGRKEGGRSSSTYSNDAAGVRTPDGLQTGESKPTPVPDEATGFEKGPDTVGTAEADSWTTAGKPQGRKHSPQRNAAGLRGKSTGRGAAGGALDKADQGDGRKVFQQLRNYLVNGASNLFVQQTVIRLNDLARNRRFKAFVRSLTKETKNGISMEELRADWKDEAPLTRRLQYEGLRSVWNPASPEHQGRLAQLMHDWVITKKEPQREIENRLQFFKFQATTEVPTPHVGTKAGTSDSYLAAVTQAKVQTSTGGMTTEQVRLRELCLKPAVPTLRLRERTADEVAAIVMILNNEIEVPRVPQFLTQSMDAGELACFEDLFMSLEYPIYAHLAPGQRFFDNLSKTAIVAQIYVGAEAAPGQKAELLDFKNGLSRISLDMETRVLKVTFKGKQSAARWIGWQMPLAGRLLTLHDYETMRERAKSSNELVPLDYYSLVAEAHKGHLTSRDIFWVMTTALELTVQAMNHASAGNEGVLEQQWNLRLKASACPPKLRKVTHVMVDTAEVVLHHNAIYVNWPCKRCYSPEHPTKFCKVLPEGMEQEQRKHTLSVAGLLPSSMGESSREYGAEERPKTMQALEMLLRKVRVQPTVAATAAENSATSPKKSTRGKSLRKGAPRRESQPLTLPAEWGQALAEPADVGNAEVDRKADAKVETTEEVAARGTPTVSTEVTSIPSSSTGLDDSGTGMADTDMPEEDDRPGMAEQYGAAVRATRTQQRKERANKKSKARGRSPTLRPRPVSAARQQQKASFSKSSMEFQRQLESANHHRPETEPTQAGDTERRTLTRQVAPTDATSCSPKRRAADDWPQERERLEDGSDEADYGSGSSPTPARSLSPKRMAREARTPGGKVALQKFIHQFMTPVSGRATEDSASTTETLTEAGDAPIAAASLEAPLEYAHTPSPGVHPRNDGEDSDGCRIVKVSEGTDTGALLSEWLTVLSGDVTDVAANGHCGWLAFYAALYNVKVGLTPPQGEVTAKANLLKKRILNEMLANLTDEMKLHPNDLAVEVVASGCSVSASSTYAEKVCALANHYVDQRDKSVNAPVPMHYWVRPAHIKAMAIHARETVYVLDVHDNGMAWMQAYAYHDVEMETDEWVETGTVCPIPTVQALTLMADLLEAGIRPPVLVLRWSPMGNHFQAVTYNEAAYGFYAENLVQLATKRNTILETHGWKSLDMVAYDETKTARAAAVALTAIRRASTGPSDRLGSTIGEAAARLRQEAPTSTTEEREASEQQSTDPAPTLQDPVPNLGPGVDDKNAAATPDAQSASARTAEDEGSRHIRLPSHLATQAPRIHQVPSPDMGQGN